MEALALTLGTVVLLLAAGVVIVVVIVALGHPFTKHTQEVAVEPHLASLRTEDRDIRSEIERLKIRWASQSTRYPNLNYSAMGAYDRFDWQRLEDLVKPKKKPTS